MAKFYLSLAIILGLASIAAIGFISYFALIDELDYMSIRYAIVIPFGLLFMFQYIRKYRGLKNG